MPTYEYACEKCGHTFDIFQSIADAPLKTCPETHCGRKKWAKGPVRRVIGGGAGLLFKGSGFYITDYRSKGYHEAAKKDSGAPAPAAKPESKPAAKSEPKPKATPAS
jgi:putative FmdB family regulatory protein